MKRAAILGIALGLVACAHVTPEDRIAAAQKVTCTGADDCELKWARATKWIQDNSHWKIQTVTPSLMTTFGPGDEVFTAYQVQKFPMGAGEYEIQFKASCNNMGLGCHPPIEKAGASFKNYVATGVLVAP